MSTYRDDDESYMEALERFLRPGDILEGQSQRALDPARAQQMLQSTRPGYEFDETTPKLPGTGLEEALRGADFSTAPSGQQPEDMALLASPPPGPSTEERKAAMRPPEPPADTTPWRTLGMIELVGDLGQGIGNIGQALGSLRPGGPQRPGPVDHSRAYSLLARADDQERQRQAQELAAAERAYDRSRTDRRLDIDERRAGLERERLDWQMDETNPQYRQRETAAGLNAAREANIRMDTRFDESRMSAYQRMNTPGTEPALAMVEEIRALPADLQRSLGIADAAGMERVEKMTAEELQELLRSVNIRDRIRIYRRGISRGGAGGAGMRDALINELMRRHSTQEEAEELVASLPDEEVQRVLRNAITSRLGVGGRMDFEFRQDAVQYADAVNKMLGAEDAAARLESALSGVSDEDIETVLLTDGIPARLTSEQTNRIRQAWAMVQAEYRKYLFGASLTGNELQAWNVLAGNERFGTAENLKRFLSMRQSVASRHRQNLDQAFAQVRHVQQGGQLIQGPTGTQPVPTPRPQRARPQRQPANLLEYLMGDE